MSVLSSAVEAVQSVFQAKKTKAIIVGSGIYGMSTALHMLQDGGYEVTVLDKCETLPAPDAASCDLNKIIRAGDYADLYLAQLAIDCVEEWRKPEWEGTYHEAGVIALSHPSNTYGHKFVTGAYANLKSMGVDAAEIPAPASSSIRRFYPDNVPTGDFGGRAGYRNPIGGWAEAGRATAVGIERARKLGGTVRGGAEVVGLVHDDTKQRELKGVKLANGEEVLGDVVVLCAGAWTPGLMSLPGVSIRMPEIIATGQSLATIQLTPEEAERYKHIPVVFCLDSGWYVFPPNEHNVMKIAIHAAGHTAPSAAHGGVSVPRTKLTPGAEDGAIPKEMAVKLRDGLREVFPELADRPFIGTRLCWYCDTVTGDWLIDYHPDYTNLFVASGDSGHAFKYAPLIGREILRGIKRQTTAYDRERWSFAGPGADAGADVRAGTRQELKLDELVTHQDLQGAPAVATTA